ncbi:hypothetical protein [Bordetella pertussis]|uniref:hypothetical protein n=1 Tax=Bordetella pertussis TaxID=520 RepID=UPI002E15E50E
MVQLFVHEQERFGELSDFVAPPARQACHRRRNPDRLGEVLGGMLVLRARLAELPDGWQARAAQLRRAGLLASAMAPATDAYCGIDQGETALYLHQRVAPAGSALAVDEAVGEFVNALATWKRAMAQWQ